MDTRDERASSAAVRDLVGRVQAELPGLVDQITRRILSEIPIYLEAGISDPEQMRSRVGENIAEAVTGLLGGAHDPSSAIDTGRARARQNMPLADVLTGYRVGYTEMLATVVRVSQAEPAIPPQVAMELGQSVFETYNQEADAVTEGFRDEAQHLLLKDERERTALIDVLLLDDPGITTLADVARGLRLPIEGAFVVVAAATQQGVDPMPRAASALGAAGVTSVWRLKYDVAVGVLSLPDSSRRDTVLALLRRHASGPVGVSPPYTTLRQTAWALDLAQLVLGRLGQDPEVEQFADSPLNMLVAGGRDAARSTAEAVLGQLLHQPAATRDVLLTTLHTWVQAEGSATRTGEILHCHPNTVRKRLRRLEQLTNRDATKPGSVTELVAAAHAWRQLRPGQASAAPADRGRATR